MNHRARLVWSFVESLYLSPLYDQVLSREGYAAPAEPQGCPVAPRRGPQPAFVPPQLSQPVGILLRLGHVGSRRTAEGWNLTAGEVSKRQSGRVLLRNLVVQIQHPQLIPAPTSTNLSVVFHHAVVYFLNNLPRGSPGALA